MPLLSLIIVLCVIGAILWVINTQITFIDANIKKIINILVIIVVCLWLLSVFGILPDLNAIRVGD